MKVDDTRQHDLEMQVAREVHANADAGLGHDPQPIGRIVGYVAVTRRSIDSHGADPEGFKMFLVPKKRVEAGRRGAEG